MKYEIVIDTETAGNIYKPETIRTYDIGWVVKATARSGGDIVARRSFVVRETWENSGLMDSAYYANKLPLYREGIERGTWRVLPLNTIRQRLLLDMVECRAYELYAYNCAFDKGALNTTITAYSHGYISEFMPINVQYMDVMTYAQDVVCMTPDYIKWAIDNGQLSEKGNVKCTAEAVYRYITKNVEFAEAHTAAEDAAIEAAILDYARRHHGPRRGSFEGRNRWAKVKALREQLGL